MPRRPYLLLLLVLCAFIISFPLIRSSRSQATNHSLLLNGTSSYVDVPYNANLNITGALTVEAWVKTGGTAFQHVVERGDWWQNQMSYDLGVGEGKVRLDIMQTNGSYAAVIGNTAMSLNAWHHIAGVYDGSQMRIYLDGVLDGTATATMAPGNNTTGLRIGKSSFLYYPNYFNGRIDEVRISNAAIYNSNFTPAIHLTATSNTKGLWKFDGQTSNDSSGSNANGSLQGSATYSTDVPTGPNAAPSISITDPLNNTNFAAGANVVIDATASDSDGSISQVEFFQGPTLLGSDSTAPYTFVWNNVAAGSYAISARATDDLGAVASTTPITVTLNQAGGDRSVLFNGTSSYVDVPYNANLNITGALTVEAWVKTGSTAFQHVVERGDWWQNQMSYDLGVGEGKVRLDIMQTNGSYAAVIGNTAMSLNVWHHIAGVYDGSQMRVYLDGVLDGTATATMAPGNNTTGLRIGKSSFLYYPNYFNGRIDEVRISNAAIYSSNFTPNAHLTATTNTKGLWKFDGETTNDSSASGANGTLQGGATYSADVPAGAGGGGQLPVATANGPYTAQLGQVISFSSSGSFDPDGTISGYHWNFGDGTSSNTASPTHTYQSSGLFTATLTVTDNAGLRASATAAVTINGGSEARLDPLNQTGGGGENALSRNFSWSLPLLSLPGRAGVNLGLALAYNSLVWTKNGSYISFDDDRGFPSPGFRLGFPVIQQLYFNAEVGKNAFLLIGPDGSRTELRQVGTSTLYEAADSSHLLLDASTMTLWTTDGTKLNYALLGGDYNCTQIKDRNGNFITINYTPSGRIDTVIDTLARGIKFNYDASGSLTSITQIWNQGATDEVTHNWVTFAYTNTAIQTNFTGLSVYGPASIKALASVTLADGSHSNFSYTSWGQVWMVSGYAADNHLLEYRSYNLAQTAANAQTDCPRFSERRDWAQYWNGDTDGSPITAEEAVTTFAAPENATWTMPDGTQQSGTSVQITEPDGTSNRIYFIGAAGTASGWRRRLPALVNTYDSAGVLQRQSMTTWTQDNTAVSYPINPRVTETNIYDPAGNRARTRVEYQQSTFSNGTSCQLPVDVYEYAANASTVLRITHTDYNTSSNYTDRRIIGLVSEKRLYEVDANNNNVLMSKVGFNYDESGSLQGTDAPVQHDNTGYTAAFVTGRGNLSSVKRYDVTNTTLFTTTSTKYNTAGAVVSSKDALNHEVTLSYLDSFSDGGNTRNTFAYPTKVTDPDGYYSTSKYNFDFGASTYQQTPPPNYTGLPANQPAGPEQTSTFDVIGRLLRQTNVVNGAYTRFEYPSSTNRIDTYTTIQDGLGEAHTFQIMDGAGRVIATALDNPDNPGKTGAYRAQRFVYDLLGRVIKTSNPVETNAVEINATQWTTTDHDEVNDWIYTLQSYDWKGRPKVTTNVDGTTKQVDYSGCGCAGGEVVSLQDEGTLINGVNKRRLQKVYSDVLGRTVKSEVWDFDGTGPGGVGRRLDSTTVTTYNARDQVTMMRQFAGAPPSPDDLSCPTGTCQKTEYTYDGYGRLTTQHVPQQNANAVTTWTYNADDTVNTITDGRGALTTYNYAGTNRMLVKSITHALSGSPTISLSYDYDAASNRISMSHSIAEAAQDSMSYVYDPLSRLTSETKHINSLESNSSTQGNYTIAYQYTLSGNLKSITDPFNATTNLNYDATGRTVSVTGSYAGTNYTYVSNIGYRAWGGLRSMGDSLPVSYTYNRRLQPTQYRWAQYRYDYTYYDDGKLKELIDLDDQVGAPSQVQFHYMSRLYRYDYVGRTAAVSGRGTPANVPAPFTGNYSFDEFGNMKSRSGHYALNQDSFDNATFVNNRRMTTGWSYDADGRLTASADTNTASTQTWTYDAKGDPITITETITATTTTTTTNTLRHDGNGDLLFESVASPSETKSDYLINSTVLATVLTKLDGNGNKDITYVPANGLVFPMQTKDFNGNPTLGGVARDASGLQEDGLAVDPFGARVRNVQPPDSSQQQANTHVFGPPYTGYGLSSFTDSNNMTTGCMLDGARTSCERVLTALSRGMATGVISYNGSAASVTNLIGYMPMNFRTTVTAYHGEFVATKISTEFVPIFGYDGDVPPEPQNPFDEPEIEKTVLGALADRGCRDFADAVLRALKRKNLGTLEDVAKAFFALPGPHFTRVRPKNSTLGVASPIGRITSRSAKIYSLGNDASITASLQMLNDADNAISELFHLAAEDAHYTDEELAKAVHNSAFSTDAYMLMSNGKPLIDPRSNIFDSRYIPDKKDKYDRDHSFSRYFHAIQMKYCTSKPGFERGVGYQPR